MSIEQGVQRLGEVAARIARGSGTRITVKAGHRTSQVPCDLRLRALIARSAEKLGLRHASLPSGAGHDAQVMARIAPVAMIFVPSHEGISHAPGEATDPVHLVSGANVLLATLLATDRVR